MPLKSILGPVKTLSFLSKCANFCNPNLVNVYLCMHHILKKEHFTFRPQHKHSGTFANYERRTLLPQKSENVQPHSSNTIENATSHDS